MTYLLNDLLDSTRFMSGKIRIDLKPLLLNEVLSQVVKAVERITKKSGITLRVSYPDEQLLVAADATRIEQALSNILHNAVKFTPRGGSISIGLARRDREVVITVRDTGAGITAEEIGHIFEPYYQSARIQGSNKNGLGIGLLLVHEIMRLHGGKVQAASEGNDKGSEFTLTLPLLKGEPPTQKEIPAALRRKEKKKEGARQILVVDDNEAAADSLVRLLNALGYQAHGLYSAMEVLAYMEKHAPHIILLDVGMPEMNGYELVKRLRREEGYALLPIIALTGYGLEEDIEKSLAAGFTAHLTKPVGIKELQRVLKKYD